MEYISKEVLKKAMYHEAFETDTKLQRWDSGCWIRYKMFENVIEHLPDADVVERKRGKWLRGEAYPHHIFCSVCYATYIPNDEWDIWKGDIRYFYVLPRRYCPNCGADMREVDE